MKHLNVECRDVFETALEQVGNVLGQLLREQTEEHVLNIIYIDFVFPEFSTLKLGNQKFGPQNQILREISSPESAPKVWNPKSRSKDVTVTFP